jgi:hypothetical protein
MGRSVGVNDKREVGNVVEEQWGELRIQGRKRREEQLHETDVCHRKRCEMEKNAE